MKKSTELLAWLWVKKKCSSAIAWMPNDSLKQQNMGLTTCTALEPCTQAVFFLEEEMSLHGDKANYPHVACLWESIFMCMQPDLF